MTNRLKKCGNCIFWCNQLDDKDGKPAYGECRRYPPTYKQNGSIMGYENARQMEYMMDTSPFEIIMHCNSWCGEHISRAGT